MFTFKICHSSLIHVSLNPFLSILYLCYEVRVGHKLFPVWRFRHECVATSQIWQDFFTAEGGDCSRITVSRTDAGVGRFISTAIRVKVLSMKKQDSK